MQQWLRSTADIRNARRFRALGFASLVAVATFASASAAPAPAPTPYGAVVPVGVKIPVELTATLTSANLHVGDRFGFKTRSALKFGTLDVPQGTPGQGRVAAVTPAAAHRDGSLTLQADSLTLPDGTPLWVNVDAARELKGRLADKHTQWHFLTISTTYSGDMVLDAGTPFTVDTIERRADPAPLVTASPVTATPAPAASATP